MNAGQRAASQEQQSGAGEAEFSPWRFALVWAACAAVLVARIPGLIFTPQLVLEDGKVFFAEAYNSPPLVALFTTYAGYWHLLPRLVAEVGTWLPLHTVPLFYSLTSLILTSLAISWFYLPHFRYLVADDWLRLAFVALVACLPGLDGLLLLSYLQWYLVLWGILFVLMEPPRRLSVQWVLAAVYLLALGTAPALHLLLPVWIWRLLAARRREQRPWLALIVVVNLLLLLLTAYAAVQGGSLQTDLSPASALLDLARGTAFRVVATPLLGYPPAQELLHRRGWLPLMLLAAGVLAAVTVAALRLLHGRRRQAVPVLLYTAAFTLGLYLVRSGVYGAPFVNGGTDVPLVAVRYFFPAIISLYLLALMLADHWLAADRTRAGWLYALLLIALLLYTPTLYIGKWPDAEWPRYAYLLEHLLAADEVTPAPASAQPPAQQAQAGATPVVLRIPISSPGWDMWLALPQDGPQGYLFPEGLRLLAVRTTTGDNSIQVDLDWQTSEAAAAHPYTVYVHLLGPDGTRLSGSDVQAPTQEGRTPNDIWITHHELPLDNGLASGDYDIAVGLYTLEQEKLTPGSAVVLPKQVHWPR